MISKANRLAQVSEYYFSKKLREVRLLIAKGKPIINAGIGSPDLQPPSEVIEAMNLAMKESSIHGYQSYQGLPELRESFSKFYANQFGVALNPDNEVLPLMGSKEGIMHISMSFLNEGDEVLIPNPGYPTYSSVTRLLGAIPKYYNLEEKNSWFPNLVDLAKTDLTKVKLMWINYPHMPTGSIADKKQLKALVDFAKSHQILLINDNPYSFILNDHPTSILSIEDAKEVTLELNSLSKTFNMAGWRVGMVAGSANHIQAVLKVKSNMDSGMFYGIQKGAIAALNMPSDWFKRMNTIYKKRRAIAWQIFDALDCPYQKDSAGLFVWACIPNGFTSEEFADRLLYDLDVFMAPGTVFGSNGEGYIRLSLCLSEEKLSQILNRVLNSNING